MKKWIKISLLSILCSCATQEEIERRELLKRLHSEMNGQQKIVKGLLLATQRIEIDLDDGVKTNYPKFGKALSKVIGLS